MNNLTTRIVSGIVYAILITLSTTALTQNLLISIGIDTIYQKYIFYALITFFFLVCLYEGIRMVEFESKIFIVVCIAIAGIIYGYFSNKYLHGYNIFPPTKIIAPILLIVLFLIGIITLFRYPNELFTDNGKAIFLGVYIGTPFATALAIPKASDDIFTPEIFFIFILIWLSDSFAYLIGRKIGKHKLAPSISPNKSIEGWVGGILGTLICGILIHMFYSQNLKGNWIIISLLIAVFAPIGDLAESKLKRIFGVKDSGTIMPGHGGLLDRLDSFIFCVPIIFLYFALQNLFN